MSTCSCCNEIFVTGSTICVCVICNDLFHQTLECAGVTASEIKVLDLKKSKPRMVYKCGACHDNGSNVDPAFKELVLDLYESVTKKLSVDVSESKKSLELLESDTIPNIHRWIKKSEKQAQSLKSEVTALTATVEKQQQVITTLKTQLNQRESTPVALSTIGTIIKETRDIQSRERNLLIFKVPDSNNLITDVNIVKDILDKLNLIPSEVKRLGLPSANKTRPLLIRMSTAEEIFKIIRNRTSLPAEFTYSMDHSPTQRALYNSAKAEADAYNATNPNSMKFVKFIHGVPTLSTGNRLPGSEN